ncbi:MAG: formylglycine-generating enzyme family protein, partial [Oceanobacter sp.]
MMPTNPAKTSVPNLPSPWACAWGEDAYGYWQAFEVKGVRQVMRWIPAGEFIQGSPEDEPERKYEEVQRQVTLTQGFWLADTACTQALWQAIMGDNPSSFKGDDLPVETVSWKDCQAFLNALKALMPEFNAQFPTEAQWEYACRAGTSTPFNWDSAELNSELANFDSRHPYANNAKSKYRGTTVDVYGSSCGFRPNNW